MFGITTIVALALAIGQQAFAAPVTDFPLEARQGYSPNCTATYTVVPGDRCIDIIAKLGSTFTLAQFYEWNPQVNSYCTNLYPGQQVCVAIAQTPPPPPACDAPVAGGMVSNCAKCYKVVEGDYCLLVAGKNGISLGDFYAWNPSVDATCSNLQLGYNYCVGV
ncbi:hypothetical protein AAE478_002263 [Parahypoxylon ruwenzoriense]